VRYRILPKVAQLASKSARREGLAIRQSSLFRPRDFDNSPYFAIVKPTIEMGFNYKNSMGPTYQIIDAKFVEEKLKMKQRDFESRESRFINLHQ
jgi:hypothetical protein